jgi:putative periplasmic protein
VEDILTSMGKEKFKELFMKYAAKKHSLDIDDVLILNIKVINNLELSEIIKAIKSQNLCSDPSVNEDVMTKPEKKKKGNEIIVAPDPNDVVQKPIDLNNVQEFGKDFGEK